MNKSVIFVLGVLTGAVAFNKKTRTKLTNLGSDVVCGVKNAFKNDDDELDEEDDEEDTSSSEESDEEDDTKE